ncbi:hypothetical protein F4823DRAFT_174604 [Ustulina deusta]|nr:hypothetical protein F4823DRAFT_174604 [Ustulina deusta]
MSAEVVAGDAGFLWRFAFALASLDLNRTGWGQATPPAAAKNGRSNPWRMCDPIDGGKQDGLVPEQYCYFGR